MCWLTFQAEVGQLFNASLPSTPDLDIANADVPKLVPVAIAHGALHRADHAAAHLPAPMLMFLGVIGMPNLLPRLSVEHQDVGAPNCPQHAVVGMQAMHRRWFAQSSIHEGDCAILNAG